MEMFFKSVNSAKGKALTAYGWELIKKENFDEAIKILHEATIYNPTEYSPHLLLAEAYKGKNILDLSIKEYQNALSLLPKQEQCNFSDLERKKIEDQLLEIQQLNLNKIDVSP